MNKTQVNCKDIQHILSSEFPDNYDKMISSHLESCPDCKKYAETLKIFGGYYSIENQENRIEPDPLIREKLVSHMKQRSEQNKNLWHKIRQVIDYRVPVYQVAAALAIVFILIFTVERIPDLSRDIYSAQPAEILPQNPELSQIYLLDSLNLKSLQNIGRNALEDSAITKYLVGAL
jgi:hypothetical protein